MVTIRLLVASLAVSLNLGVAQAADPERTGSTDLMLDAHLALHARSVITDPTLTEPGRTTSVILPELSVTSYVLASRPLPPLKPLPKWDPHVCIGC